MKLSALILFALAVATAFAKDLRSGNVLSSIQGVNGWGKLIPDLIFIVLTWIPMFWCTVMGFLSGLGGDNLIGWQKCWANWFNIVYGGDW
jgi:hypothetical protein